MCLPRVAALCALSAALFAAPSGDVWHPPQPVPRECVTPQFEAVLLDVSGSMRRRGLFDEQKKNIEDYLTNTARSCTLVIIGSFGVTADVHEAQFLTSGDGRERLVAAVRRLRPTQPSTNLDEAAKLVELLSYQLREAYGPAANRLVVRVYSDFESSPSLGKPRFSLAEYLARRMNGQFTRSSAPDGTPQEVVQVSAKAVPNSTVASAPPAVAWGKALATRAGGAAVLLVGLCSVLWVRSRVRRRVDHVASPAALLVTERAGGEQAGSGIMSPEKRVEVAPGVPIVFSTETDFATYIAAAIPQAESGELFRIVPLPTGFMQIQSQHPSLTVNNEPLGMSGQLEIGIREPIQIRLGPRVFNIIAVFDRPNEREHAGIFEAAPLQH